MGGMDRLTLTRSGIMETERRKHKRYDVNSQSLKVVAVADRKKIAVKDLSLGGAMVEYNPVAIESPKTELLDVVAHLHQQVYLPGVNCRTIYDILGLAENRSFSGEPVRCRGLKFVGLTESQADALRIIIDRLRDDSSAD